MIKIVTKFIKNQSGATAIENGLLYSLVGIALISGATMVGTNMSRSFDTASSAMTPTNTPVPPRSGNPGQGSGNSGSPMSGPQFAPAAIGLNGYGGNSGPPTQGMASASSPENYGGPASAPAKMGPPFKGSKP